VRWAGWPPVDDQAGLDCSPVLRDLLTAEQYPTTTSSTRRCSSGGDITGSYPSTCRPHDVTVFLATIGATCWRWPSAPASPPPADSVDDQWVDVCSRCFSCGSQPVLDSAGRTRDQMAVRAGVEEGLDQLPEPVLAAKFVPPQVPPTPTAPSTSRSSSRRSVRGPIVVVVAATTISRPGSAPASKTTVTPTRSDTVLLAMPRLDPANPALLSALRPDRIALDLRRRFHACQRLHRGRLNWRRGRSRWSGGHRRPARG
jgi:hypothetical protein